MIKKKCRIAAEGAYYADHDGRIFPIEFHRPVKWFYWYHYISRYNKAGNRVFYCPNNPKAALQPMRNEADDTYGLVPEALFPRALSYGANYTFGPIVDPVKKTGDHPYNIRAVEDPSYLIVAGDANGGIIRPNRWFGEADIALRHENKGWFLMADGHSEKLGRSTMGLLHQCRGWRADPKRWKNWKKDWK